MIYEFLVSAPKLELQREGKEEEGRTLVLRAAILRSISSWLSLSHRLRCLFQCSGSYSFFGESFTSNWHLSHNTLCASIIRTYGSVRSFARLSAARAVAPDDLLHVHRA